MTDPSRPNPDRLLDQLQAQERASNMGGLKIFFGASPGVGKTCAMLRSARQLKEAGVDVVVGLVETHGRADTAALLEGLELLPKRELEVGAQRFAEFDVDAALARKPAVLLVDELAHTNVAGSRHPKRWQDIAELRRAGITVHSTVNVQHLESLNDVVGGITGVRVRETVPDHVIDGATEIVLIDLPVDELLDRLKAGKIYLPQVAEQAQRHFFRKGNLVALRELALRRTAERVDHDVQTWRRGRDVDPVWQTHDSLLACIPADAQAAAVVRYAARLAQRMDVPCVALHVDTPALAHASDAQRELALAALKLAQELGASTATRTEPDLARAIVAHAREHNISTVVLGPSSTSTRPWWMRWFARPALSESLSRHAPELALVRSATALPVTPAIASPGKRSVHAPGQHYLYAALLMVLTTLVATPLLDRLDLANIVMLFLLAQVACGYWLGRGPSILAAVLGVLCFDVFFVDPRFSLAVSDGQYLITFAVMLVVGLLVGQLTANLRFQARAARQREHRTRILFEMARDLSSAIAVEQIAEISTRALEAGFGAQAALLSLDLDERLLVIGDSAVAGDVDAGIARWALDHGKPAGLGTDTLAGAGMRYLPLLAPMRTRGVLALKPRQPLALNAPDQANLLETFAHLIAIAIERVHYTDVARSALVRMESERLRNTLLAAIGHDLRTPLTALIGFADTLERRRDALDASSLELVHTIHGQARRIHTLVENLLDMARIEAGQAQLRKSWWPLEDILGAALRGCSEALAGHRLQTQLPEELPLVEVDAVLLERVFANLLENAAKYSDPGSAIEVTATALDSHLQIKVSDRGRGFPAGHEERMFEKFTRGHEESSVAGTGLGLAICRAIIEAHGGVIKARNRAGGGAVLSFTLPLGKPPPMLAEDLTRE